MVFQWSEQRIWILFAHNLRRSQMYRIVGKIPITLKFDFHMSNLKEVVEDDIFYAMLSSSLFKWKSEKLLLFLLLGVLLNSQ